MLIHVSAYPDLLFVSSVLFVGKFGCGGSGAGLPLPVSGFRVFYFSQKLK